MHSFFGYGYNPSLDITSPKNGILVHLSDTDFYLVLGCLDGISALLYQLWSDSMHLLVWEVNHLVLGLCVLALWVPGYILQGIDRIILCY